MLVYHRLMVKGNNLAAPKRATAKHKHEGKRAAPRGASTRTSASKPRLVAVLGGVFAAILCCSFLPSGLWLRHYR